MSTPIDPKTLERAFSPEQAAALAAALSSVRTSQVTRQEVEELRRLVQRLVERLDVLAPVDQVPEEHLAIMSAVFAAYIGKRIRIRSARVLSNQSSWAQAGRTSLHAQRNVRRP
jgi:hypothetical protein